MGLKFDKPICVTIHFGHDVITSSGCGCDVAGLDLGGCDDYNCVGQDKPICECGNDGANCVDPNA